MQSVFEQTQQDFEYIIIDGGSSDGSKKVIESHADKLTYWLSEPDEGIYNAMNKGIKIASGEYLLFINSGDLLKSPSTIENAFPYLISSDIVYGNLELIKEERVITCKFPSKLTFQYLYRGWLPHPSTFIKKSLFERCGFYDASLKICADWKFFIEAICKWQATYEYVDTVWSIHYSGGISTLPENEDLVAREKSEYLFSNFLAFMPDYEAFGRQNKSKWVKFLKKIKLI